MPTFTSQKDYIRAVSNYQESLKPRDNRLSNALSGIGGKPARGGKMKSAVVKDPVAKMKKGGSVKPAVVKEKVAAMKKGGEVKGLTAKQKAKLPKALQEAILKKRGLKK